MGEPVGRDRELGELAGLVRAVEAGAGARLAVVGGRRGVGKTWLLEHALRTVRTCHYVAADVEPAVNRRELVGALLSATAGVQGTEQPRPADWRELVRLLAELSAERPLAVVLDEFQHLRRREDLLAALTAEWEPTLSRSRLLLVLCGSTAAVSAACGAGSPLAGHVSWRAELEPLDFAMAGRLHPGRMVRERALLYGVFGGTPRLAGAVQQGWTLAQAVQELMLSPRGDVHHELAGAVAQGTGLRETAEYHSVLGALAAGATGTLEVATAAGLGDRAHVARRALEVLEGLQLVARERNIDGGGRSAWHSRIADPALCFWYRFVLPLRSLLERGRVRDAWTAVAPHLDGYMDDVVLGTMVRQAWPRLARRHGLPAWSGEGGWEGRDRNRRRIRIAIAARLPDGRVLAGAVRWAQAPADADMHLHLLRDLEDVAATGHAWAADALDPDRSAGFVHVSAAGFTSQFRERARRDGRTTLLDLEQLYNA
jgi:uncharacterized protein